LNIKSKYTIEKDKGSTISIRRVFKFAEKPPRVFICYSSKDRDFAQKLAKDLTTYGIMVWYDEYEIKVGDSITEKISKALQECDYLCIILSPDSVNSEWVKRELSVALLDELDHKRVKVLPILWKDCQVPPLIQDKRRANFSHIYEKGLEELLDRFS
jgi:hypothetical protein